MSKYIKVLFDKKGANYEYKLNQVNVARNWNPKAEKGRDFGGFNYTTEDCILRWLHRGDTLYDVEVPNDAESVKLDGATTIYRSNKIIISNPRKVDDDLALHFYEVSQIPEKSYYKSLAVVSIMNYKKTAYAILRDKVNTDNIGLVLSEWNDFINHGGDEENDNNQLVNEIKDYLLEINSDLLISRFVDKEPYIKELTKDKVINLTGESGSGKSYFSKDYINDENYIVIDTDMVFNNDATDNKELLQIRELFKNEAKDILNNDFDKFYLKVLDHFKDSDKTLVIDSAQYRNIKDVSLLKGQIIVIRTSIEKCYQRCIDRWLSSRKEYTQEEKEKYMEKKSGMFRWYKSLNEFLKKVDKLK